MLDKSVPYVDICMRREPGTPNPAGALPPGYRFAYYAPGDEKSWARIETSVLEFDSEMDALLYFQRDFLPYGPELPLRMLFVETDTGGEPEKVATASAWWAYTGPRRDPTVHWVAVKPAHQGLGVGKALIARVIDRMIEIEGDRAFYLHTQTWSHKAVKLYQRAGFYITDEPNVQGCANNRTAEAAAVLKAIGEGGRYGA